MHRTLLRAGTVVAAAALSASLLAGCSSDEELPDVNTQGTQQPSGPSVIGFMESVTANQVVLTMPDGTNRRFAVRPEDSSKLGLSHLASHRGFTDVGFEVFYETEGGVDYIVGSRETAPPQ